jgi:hypothetical protein
MDHFTGQGGFNNVIGEPMTLLRNHTRWAVEVGPRVNSFLTKINTDGTSCALGSHTVLDLSLQRLSHGAHFQNPPHRVRWRLLIQCSKRGPCLVRLQVPHPSKVAHQSVSSVIDSENVPAALEIAETRWPGEL